MQLSDRRAAAGEPADDFLWLQLANSLEWDGFGKQTDHLQEAGWIVRKLKDWALALSVPHPVPLRDLLELRTLLRRLSAKIEQQQELNAGDLAALNAYLNVPVRVKLIQRQNGAHRGASRRGSKGIRSELVPLQKGWPWLLSRFAVSFADMLALDRPERLKFCRNEGCKWIFYDQTKANTRRWCNDRTCGNRARVQRSRERAKRTAGA